MPFQWSRKKNAVFVLKVLLNNFRFNLSIPLRNSAKAPRLPIKTINTSCSGRLCIDRESQSLYNSLLFRASLIIARSSKTTGHLRHNSGYVFSSAIGVAGKCQKEYDLEK